MRTLPKYKRLFCGSGQRFVTTLKIQPFQNKYGPPGRAANSGITATIFGAYGFIGRYYLQELGLVGSRAYVPFRGCEMEVRHFKPMFDLGQLGLMPFSPRDEQSIYESLKNSDIVINMIGKHYETKHVIPTRRADGSLSRINYTYEDVHIKIPETIARLSKEAGVKAFIHMSALAANPDSVSRWAQSKAWGEQAVRQQFPSAIIVRPATVFGPEDRFLNWIAEAMKRLPFTPLINGGQTLCQPVYSVDIGKALMLMTYNWKQLQGSTFQLVGPAEYSYKEIAEYVSDVILINKPLIDVPRPIAKAAGYLLDMTISPFLTPDNIDQLYENVVANNDPKAKLLGFEDLGIEPASMDKVAFDYLHRFRPGGHFRLVKGYH